MSYLYFWIQDNYPSFTKLDTLRLYNRFDIANTLLASSEGKHSKIIHKKSGYSVQIMYKKYIAAPWDGTKIKEAINYLVKEINDIEDCFLVTDSKRGFSHGDRKLNNKEGYIAGVVYSSESTDNDPTNIISTFGGFSGMGLRLGAEYDILTKADNYESNIISVSTNYSVMENIDVYVRYDMWDNNIIYCVKSYQYKSK